mmetsp:Transcript_140173/g.244136  ORF Transcript_140173/g.244136 Transcript_140173/m.244136 type:complete len:222 (-) Transcript_140173:1372-2037(-)
MRKFVLVEEPLQHVQGNSEAQKAACGHQPQRPCSKAQGKEQAKASGGVAQVDHGAQSLQAVLAVFGVGVPALKEDGPVHLPWGKGRGAWGPGERPAPHRRHPSAEAEDVAVGRRRGEDTVHVALGRGHRAIDAVPAMSQDLLLVVEEGHVLVQEEGRHDVEEPYGDAWGERAQGGGQGPPPDDRGGDFALRARDVGLAADVPDVPRADGGGIQHQRGCGPV